MEVNNSSRQVRKGRKLDVFGVGVVFDSVARGLAGVVDLILF